MFPKPPLKTTQNEPKKKAKTPAKRVPIISPKNGLVATVTVDALTAQIRNRLVAYLEEFFTAEGLVLKHRGRTTQLIALAGEPRLGEVVYRAWLGDQFVGTVQAVSDSEARKRMRAYLHEGGYSKRSTEALTIQQSVSGWPDPEFVSYLESANEKAPEHDSQTQPS